MVHLSIFHIELLRCLFLAQKSYLSPNTKIRHCQVNQLLQHVRSLHLLLRKPEKVIRDQLVIDLIKVQDIHAHHISNVQIQNPVFLAFYTKLVSNSQLEFVFLFQFLDFVKAGEGDFEFFLGCFSVFEVLGEGFGGFESDVVEVSDLSACFLKDAYEVFVGGLMHGDAFADGVAFLVDAAV